MSSSLQKPEAAVGAIVSHEGRILLVRRRRPPGEGLWAVPGGRVRLGEGLRQAVEREVLEETGVVVEAEEPVYTFDLIERDGGGRVVFHYVIVDFQARYVRGELNPGDDASDARWVSHEDMAELEMAETTRQVLERSRRMNGSYTS